MEKAEKMEKAYKNLGYILLLLIPFTFLGFYKSYFNQFPGFEDTRTFIHLHAAIASIWVVILLVQPFLIRNKKYKQHRIVGKISYVVFPLLILSFIPGMLKMANAGSPNLFFPLSDVIMLIILYALAIYHKKNVAKHMRYMIGIALVFLDPTLGRIGVLLLELTDMVNQNLLCGIIYLMLIGLILLDRKNGKNFKPYLLILSLWVIHQITFNLIF
jgi:hypothetical protein